MKNKKNKTANSESSPKAILDPQKQVTKGSKPLLPLISRRIFLGTSTVSLLGAALTPWGLPAIAEPANAAYKFPWDIFWAGAGLAANIMGYGTAFQLAKNLFESIKEKDPNRAAAIAANIASLKSLGFKDPRTTNYPEFGGAYQTGDGRIAIPFVHKTIPNGVVAYYGNNNAAVQLSAPTQFAILGIDQGLRADDLQLNPEKIPSMVAPMSQIGDPAYTKFETSARSEAQCDRYISLANNKVRVLSYEITPTDPKYWGKLCYLIENVTDVDGSTRFLRGNTLICRDKNKCAPTSTKSPCPTPTPTPVAT